MTVYTVAYEFDDRALLEEWLEWLREEHTTSVCDAGALQAEVVELEALARSGRAVYRAEARFWFASHDEYRSYVRGPGADHRDAELERIPADRGVRVERRAGVVDHRVHGTRVPAEAA